jgi:hypothetical protein
MKFRRCVVCGLLVAGGQVMHRSCGTVAFEPSSMNGRNDNEAQRDGGIAALPRSGTKRRLIYDEIIAAEREGRINDELCDAIDIPYNSVGPRVRELRGAKILGSDPPRYHPILVKDSGRRRPGKSGVGQMIWIGVQYQ